MSIGKAKKDLCIRNNNVITRFGVELGETPIEFMTKHRIEIAKILICKTEMSIASIASYIGYRSSSAFCQAFKRREGETPGSYRGKI